MAGESTLLNGYLVNSAEIYKLNAILRKSYRLKNIRVMPQ